MFPMKIMRSSGAFSLGCVAERSQKVAVGSLRCGVTIGYGRRQYEPTRIEIFDSLLGRENLLPGYCWMSLEATTSIRQEIPP
jgi:hypothetical protein